MSNTLLNSSLLTLAAVSIQVLSLLYVYMLYDLYVNMIYRAPRFYQIPNVLKPEHSRVPNIV